MNYFLVFIMLFATLNGTNNTAPTYTIVFGQQEAPATNSTGTNNTVIYLNEADRARVLTSILGTDLTAVVEDVQAATDAHTPSTLVKRNSSGNIATMNLAVGGDITITGSTTFNHGCPGTPQQVLTVSKGPIAGPNHFNSIKAAVDSITDASANNAYVINVGPGRFIEDTITLQPFVSIVGHSIFGTIIEVDSTSKNVLVGARASIIRFCTLQGATNTGKAAIVYNDTGNFRIRWCNFGANNILIKQTAGSGDSAVTIDNCEAQTDSNFVTGFSLAGGATYRTTMTVQGFTWQPTTAQTQLVDMANVSGQLASFQCSDSILGAPLPSTTYIGGNALTISNGATIRANNVSLNGFAKGLYAPSIGAGPILQIDSLFGSNNTVDLQINHGGTTGSLSASMSRTRSTINDDATISLFLKDPENQGIVYIGNTYTGSTFDAITNINTLTEEGAPLGVISGGVLSHTTGRNIQAALGTGYLQHPTGSIKYIEWTTQSVNLPSNSDNFIYVDYTGTMTSAASLPDREATILLGKARSTSSDILYIQQIPQSAHHTATNLVSTIATFFGPIYHSGSIVSKNGTLALDVSSGSYALGATTFSPSGGSNISWSAFYRNGSGNFTITSQSSIDYNHYDTGTGTLATLSTDQYARHTLFVVGDGSDEKYVLVYGQSSYTSLSEAENGDLPPVPGSWSGNITLIASIIVQNTTVAANRIAEIRDERPRINFKASGVSVVTDHGDLTGLLDDDHTQYLLANGARAMTGSLNMGNNNIVTSGLVDGVDVSTHAARHLPNDGADALAVAAPVTIGSSNSAGTQNSFARSDHVHDHGSQTGGSTHSAATTSTAGFMSAADKTILDAATNANTASTMVKRDSSGNFSAGTISTGNVTINASGTNVLNAIGSVSSISKQRLIGGSVNTSTSATSGSGFTYTDGASAGLGTVNFTNAFSTTPFVTMSTLPVTAGQNPFANLTAVATTSFSFAVVKDNGAATDATVNFIAMGTVT